MNKHIVDCSYKILDLNKDLRIPCRLNSSLRANEMNEVILCMRGDCRVAEFIPLWGTPRNDHLRKSC